MREIKYRVFGKENQIMLDWNEILNAPDMKEFLLHAHEEDGYYSPLMQYTGLKDQNGREIYESDILEVESEGYPFKMNWKGSVKFLDGSFLIENLAGDDGEYLFDETREVSIIGNIYEDSEMLETK